MPEAIATIRTPINEQKIDPKIQETQQIDSMRLPSIESMLRGLTHQEMKTEIEVFKRIGALLGLPASKMEFPGPAEMSLHGEHAFFSTVVGQALGQQEWRHGPLSDMSPVSNLLLKEQIDTLLQSTPSLKHRFDIAKKQFEVLGKLEAERLKSQNPALDLLK